MAGDLTYRIVLEEGPGGGTPGTPAPSAPSGTPEKSDEPTPAWDTTGQGAPAISTQPAQSREEFERDLHANQARMYAEAAAQQAAHQADLDASRAETQAHLDFARAALAAREQMQAVADAAAAARDALIGTLPGLDELKLQPEAGEAPPAETVQYAGETLPDTGELKLAGEEKSSRTLQREQQEAEAQAQERLIYDAAKDARRTLREAVYENVRTLAEGSAGDGQAGPEPDVYRVKDEFGAGLVDPYKLQEEEIADVQPVKADQDVHARKKRREEREQYDKDVRDARARLDPEEQSRRDMHAAGGLLDRAGMGGSTSSALENMGELQKLPEAISGIGEAGGLEAAAGPAGAVMTLANEKAKEWAQSIDDTRKDIELFGKVTADVVKNDYMGAFNRQVEASADKLKEIPIAGQVFAAGLELAVQPLRTFTDVVGSFVQRGGELAQYSGEISTARAIVEVRDIVADLKEAQALGGSIARITDTSDEIWVEIRDILLPLKDAIAGSLADALEEIRDAIKEIAPSVKEGIQWVIWLAREFGRFFAWIGQAVIDMLKWLGALVVETRKVEQNTRKDEERIFEEIDADIDRIFGGGKSFAAPASIAAENGLGVPGLGGGF